MTRKELDSNSVLSEKMPSNRTVNSKLSWRNGNPVSNLSTKDVSLTMRMRTNLNQKPKEMKLSRLLKLSTLKQRLSSKSANTLSQRILGSGIYSLDSLTVTKESMTQRRKFWEDSESTKETWELPRFFRSKNSEQQFTGRHNSWISQQMNSERSISLMSGKSPASQWDNWA